jgi:hypothetical protein
MEAIEKESGDRPMSDGQAEVRRLTSVELLDAVWREIGSEEPQPGAGVSRGAFHAARALAINPFDGA